VARRAVSHGSGQHPRSNPSRPQSFLLPTPFQILPVRPQIEWLPPCAPELNPTEQVWNHTMYGDWANFIPDHIDQAAEAIMISITAQHHDNELIRSYFKYAQLEL
jgi:hypothetical protein